MAVRNLNVELCGASGLKNSEYIGKSDPYVILSIGKTERKSKVAQDQATAPSWNEKFTLPVVESDTELVVRILNDNSMAKDDELGRAVIALSEIHGSHSASTFGLQFKGKTQGELKINLSFEGEGDHESKGLVGKIHDLFVSEKKEAHAEKNKEEEEKNESHEEHHKDQGLKEKLKEKIEELKEKPEGKKDESGKKKKEGVEEKAEKKRKIKKVKEEKSKESEDEGSSSSSSDSDSESDKESVKEDDIEEQNAREE